MVTLVSGRMKKMTGKERVRIRANVKVRPGARVAGMFKFGAGAGVRV